jgi:ELWxxDGT repeat protein
MGRELWVSDGTARGTHPVRDIVPGPGDGIATLPFPTPLGRWLFFVGSTQDPGPELWKTDGTARGTVRVFERPVFFASVELMLSVDGKLLFRADDRVHGAGPWVSDGTEKGTRILRDIALGEESSSPIAFTRAGSRVFFIANDGFTGMEPWAVPVSSLGQE